MLRRLKDQLVSLAVHGDGGFRGVPTPGIHFHKEVVLHNHRILEGEGGLGHPVGLEQIVPEGNAVGIGGIDQLKDVVVGNGAAGDGHILHAPDVEHKAHRHFLAQGVEAGVGNGDVPGIQQVHTPDGALIDAALPDRDPLAIDGIDADGAAAVKAQPLQGNALAVVHPEHAALAGLRHFRMAQGHISQGHILTILQHQDIDGAGVGIDLGVIHARAPDGQVLQVLQL